MTARSPLGSRLPIVGAPMAGGPTSVALATEVARAGAFPFLAAGYKTTAALAAEIERMREVGLPFGVNLFVPGAQGWEAAELDAYAQRLRPEAAELGVELGAPPSHDDDEWGAKVAHLIANPVPVVSLTFGLPPRRDIAALRASGTRVLATITTVAEARGAAAAGVDGLVAQGTDAGGHSATHDPARALEPVAAEQLVREVRQAVDLPVIAAGGVDGPGAVRALLDSGADAVAVGTLLLRTDEAGTSQTHRDALADPAFEETVITHAFTGRPARALRNGFVDRHGAHAPLAYPAVHHLTRELRRAASATGDADRLHLWAGTGYRSAPSGPVADVIRWLAASA
jgi:nitronate monooxygenase